MSQQLYLPIDGIYPIPYALEADTFPVPRAEFSALSALEKKKLTAAESIIYLTLCHGSTYASGASWCFSSPYLSKFLGKGMSRPYAQKLLGSLKQKGWIEPIETENPAGKRYRVIHHLCDPVMVPLNEDGKPLTFAVPRGPGGPLERCEAGEISWKSALVWINLKLRSEWQGGIDTSGQTDKAAMHELSQRCRMDLTNFQNRITELEQAGMLQRLTPKSQLAIYQLYPKPYPRPASRPSRTPAPPSKTLEFDGEGYYNETHYYSLNKVYRCEREALDTFDIEARTQSGWKKVSEFHRSQQMNPDIIDYFERCLAAKRGVETEIFGGNL